MGPSGRESSDRPDPRDPGVSEPDASTVDAPQGGSLGPIEEVLAEPEVKAPAEAELRTFLVADIRGYTKVGGGYVQPAIGAVDLLSLCRKDTTGAPSSSPAP